MTDEQLKEGPSQGSSAGRLYAAVEEGETISTGERFSSGFFDDTVFGKIKRKIEDEGFVGALRQTVGLGNFGHVNEDNDEEGFPQDITQEELDRRNLRVQTEQEWTESVQHAGDWLGIPALTPETNPYEHTDELLQGIPLEYADEVLDAGDLNAARRARQRIIDDFERGQRFSSDTSLSGAVAQFAGSLLDVDAPLALVSLGTYGAGKAALTGLKVARATGLGTQGARRVSGALVGANAGLQSGVFLGAVDAAVSETTDWTAIAEYALSGVAFGGTLNAAFKLDTATAVQAAKNQLYKDLSDGVYDTPLPNIDKQPKDGVAVEEPHSDVSAGIDNQPCKL